MAAGPPFDSSADEDGAVAGNGGTTPSPATVHRAAAAYAGVLAVAGTLTATAAAGTSLPALVGATLLAFAIGAGGGWAVSRRVPALPRRLGRVQLRRSTLVAIATIVLPAIPFALVALAALLGRIDGPVEFAALWSVVAIVFSGYLLVRAAQTHYATAMTADLPIAAYRWHPSRLPWPHRYAVPAWLLIAGAFAYAGDWIDALFWGSLGLFLLGLGLLEGRIRIGELGSRPELRIHEAGFVKRRSYAASFVSWAQVDHVRLDGDELVVDCDSFVVRFGRDDLEVDALEDVLGTIEDRLQRT